MPWNYRWLGHKERLRTNMQGVIVIIFIFVFSVVILNLYYGSSTAAKKRVCAGNLKDLYMALTNYSQDYDSQYPIQQDWAHVLYDYVDNPGSFICPEDEHVRISGREHGMTEAVSYWYIKPQSIESDSSFKLCGDRMFSNLIGNHLDGGNVLENSGGVIWVKSEDWSNLNLPVEQMDPRRKNKHS
jgi:hypothetical protein